MSLPALLDQRLRLPMVAAPMFLVSNPQLVLACCRSGIVGSFPALNQRESSGFEGWLEEIGAGLQALDNPAPYAVNLIVHNTNPRLQADLRICVEHRVPIVITSLGAVREVVDAVHSYGGLVFHDVTTRRHAETFITPRPRLPSIRRKPPSAENGLSSGRRMASSRLRSGPSRQTSRPSSRNGSRV